MPTIVDLPELIAALPAERRARFERIFRVDRVAGECRVPDAMRPWVEAQFGSVAAVERQTVVRVTNRVTFDGALFNPLRRWRPVTLYEDGRETQDAIRKTQNVNRQPPIEAPFADPVHLTTEDVFGRVRGEHCITASNVARWEGQCAVLIFDEPDPLAFTRAHLRDYFRTSLAWARRAHQHDPQARYFVWIWNGGLKGGASVPHAHAQMGLGRGMHYAKVELLRRAALAYRAQYDANYFDDLLAAHDDVGLGLRAGRLRGFVYLAANRPKDTWIYGRALDDDLADALHDALRALIERADMRAFDVAVLMPPLFPLTAAHSLQGEGVEDWSGFPVIVRIGDRGAPEMRSSDIGAIDLYAHNTISMDPFEVKPLLMESGLS
ncbi:MAG: hypothetical protein CUN48_08375 [Candidatus Thermofonsia Clade 3 bacterium]|jgi:hypothetical protein|uniref:DUF4921 domain-containing protein n=1 Tax=Candidatus Thermofonsia Clade 3 bacterium TaxID=2364212 RepID=A0A2M8QCG5_9CHLR|nr:hypothetical protein [Candidatus Roseilinea sp. NK_OTU-006]PJF47503.1 MAG: hypothetical protein CUN48_08375 [Candidatus Thermofonsia Clade 3 bacterium]